MSVIFSDRPMQCTWYLQIRDSSANNLVQRAILLALSLQAVYPSILILYSKRAYQL